MGKKQSSPENSNRESADDGSPLWDSLVQIYPDNVFLKDDTIYALPANLIDQIEEKTDLFSEEELSFEKDLARSGGGGFFLKRPFGYLSLAKRTLASEERGSFAEARETNQRLKEMLAESYRSQGLSDAQIKKEMEAEKSTESKITERQEGFAGWLLTNPEFHQQREQLLEKWKSKLTEDPQYLSFPLSVMGETPTVSEDNREITTDVLNFMKTWNLCEMTTWALPTPMTPGWGKPDFLSREHLNNTSQLHLGNAGIHVFLPWYLLKNEDFTIHDLVRRRQKFDTPPNLVGWTQNTKTKLGSKRFALMLRLYVWLELALRHRYGSRLKGLSEKLDHAFSCYLNSDDNSEDASFETVKKTRQKMNHLLTEVELAREANRREILMSAQDDHRRSIRFGSAPVLLVTACMINREDPDSFFEILFIGSFLSRRHSTQSPVTWRVSAQRMSSMEIVCRR